MRASLAVGFLCLSISSALVAACAAWRGTSTPAAAPEQRAMTIELLGFPGCPNTPRMRTNLKAALKEVDGHPAFTDTNQEELPPNDIRRGWPTPTILVNGRDLFGMAPPSAPTMGCRMYAGGVPDAAAIAGRFRALGTVR